MTDFDFQSIAAYDDSQFREASDRLVADKEFMPIVNWFFPTLSQEDLQRKIKRMRNIADFQRKMIAPTIKRILARTSNGVTVSGLENIDKKRCYLFLSTHRDIILDSAMLNHCLLGNGYNTVKSAIGDNLFAKQWIIDLAKLNKTFAVSRNLKGRDLLMASKRLSAYIGKQVTENTDSVWLAQREGRAKDGHDATQAGILKMLSLARKEGAIEHLEALNIVPIAISYELDPCDMYKAIELVMVRKHGSYKKRPGEDVRSMALGVTGPKGRIHLSIGTPLNYENARTETGLNNQIRVVTADCDAQIYRDFHLFPTNYMAYDLLHNTNVHAAHYSSSEKDRFLMRIDHQIQHLPTGLSISDRKDIELAIYSIYARPVECRERHQ